ncbi:MAG: prepilin peptidase [Candidatus Delongbacteria bacterium]|nr:prepilin peptidase [Candidatus Delongbacteria bacterium]
MSETFRLFFSSWYVYLIFGMLFGSFLNVVIYRVPLGLSIVSPPSSCPKCGHMIRWYENIPVFGWIFLKGKCSKCKLPISVEYPVVELIVGLMTLGLFFHFGPSLALIVFIPLSYILFCITLVDYKTYSIPYGLNISLFVTAAAGVIINYFADNFLQLSLAGSLLGALTGFGMLYLIQIAGKIIYKQDAIGTGDLYLFGSAGLLMGPKLTFFAFMFASLAAVISFAIPSIVNLMRKKKEALYYLKEADKLDTSKIASADDKVDILSLKLQLSYNFKDGKYSDLENRIREILEKKTVSNIVLLRLFFRFSAVKDNFTAADIMKAVNLKSSSLSGDIKKVIHEDLIGYDSPKDNLDFLAEAALNSGMIELKKLIAEKRKELLSSDNAEKISDVENKLESLNSDEEKLDYLLQQNRFYQFNGYVAEQKKMLELIESLPSFSLSGFRRKYLSDLSFVYYKDFFFKDSKKSFDELTEMIKKDSADASTVKYILNMALFRIYFYRQRLAFGPFLSVGIMASLLWGEKIIGMYFEMLENMLY